MIELRDNCWAVEVPEGARNFRFGKSERLKEKVFYNTTLDYFPGSQVIEVGPGTWEIVCTSKDVKVEHASLIVETKDDLFYKCYGGNRPHISVIDSFKCLLASKGCDLTKNYLIIKKTT